MHMHGLKLYRVGEGGDISYLAAEPNYYFPVNMPDGTVALFPLRQAIIAEIDRIVEVVYPSAPAEPTDGEQTGEDQPQKEGEQPEG